MGCYYCGRNYCGGRRDCPDRNRCAECGEYVEGEACDNCGTPHDRDPDPDA